MATQYLKTNGGTIAYDDVGQGPLVICVPSMGDLRQEYRLLTPKLVAAGYRVVTMDVRGHGESSAQWSDFSVVGVGQDILAMIDYLKAGSAIVIGTSMAAGAAVWAVVEQPAKITGLVLLGPVVRNAPMPAYMTLLLKVMFAPMWGATSWGMYFNSLFPSAKPSDYAEYKQKLVNNLREPGRLAALRNMLFAPKDTSETRVQQVNVPTFVIIGTKDPDFKDPIAEANWLAEQTHGKVMLMNGIGHYPHVEAIEQTAQPIIDFLKQ